MEGAEKMIRKVTDQRLPSAPRKIAEGERARELRHKGFCPYPLAETADGETGKDADPQTLAYHAQDQSVIVRVHRRQVGKVPRIEKRRDARVRRHDEGERGECGLAGIFYGVNIAGTGACRDRAADSSPLKTKTAPCKKGRFVLYSYCK